MKSTRLLIPETPLQILPSLAKAIGLNETIILQQLHYWLLSSKHLYDNRYWVYNSYLEWQKQFPFWSISTIKKTILKLENINLIKSNNFNSLKLDRTKWYTINYDILDKISLDIINEQSHGSDLDTHEIKLTPSEGQINPSNTKKEISSSSKEEEMRISETSHINQENSSENRMIRRRFNNDDKERIHWAIEEWNKYPNVPRHQNLATNTYKRCVKIFNQLRNGTFVTRRSKLQKFIIGHNLPPAYKTLKWNKKDISIALKRMSWLYSNRECTKNLPRSLLALLWNPYSSTKFYSYFLYCTWNYKKVKKKRDEKDSTFIGTVIHGLKPGFKVNPKTKEVEYFGNDPKYLQRKEDCKKCPYGLEFGWDWDRKLKCNNCLDNNPRYFEVCTNRYDFIQALNKSGTCYTLLVQEYKDKIDKEIDSILDAEYLLERKRKEEKNKKGFNTLSANNFI